MKKIIAEKNNIIYTIRKDCINDYHIREFEKMSYLTGYLLEEIKRYNLECIKKFLRDKKILT